MFINNVSAVLAIEIVSLTLSASATNQGINVPILVTANLSGIGPAGDVMSLTDGGDGGTFFEAVDDTCSDIPVGSFAIPAETTSIQFCYTNSTPGTYNIVADLEEILASDSVTLSFFVEPTIDLSLSESEIAVGQDSNYSGYVFTDEGGFRSVETYVYTERGCDSDVYFSDSLSISGVSEGSYDYRYEGILNISELGQYSIETLLVDGEGGIYATSECQNFTVEPDGATGFITIEKVVENYTSEEPWSFDFSGTIGSFTLHEDVETEYKRMSPASVIYSEIPSGDVTITEEKESNWRMTNVSCRYDGMSAKMSSESEEMTEVPVSVDYNNQTFTVGVPSYESVYCVVTNTFAQERNSSSGTKVGVREKSLPTAPKAPTVAQDATVPTCQLLLNDYLRKGWDNKADEVTKLQKFLNEQGIVVPVTGFFGDLTEEAVKKFQAEYLKDILSPWGIDYVTGFVYKTTRYKINNMVCPGSEEMPTL